MKKSKQKEYIKEKGYKLNIKWILIIFILIMIMSLMYVKYIQELTYKNIYKNISELSEQTATQLKLSITEQKKFV